MADDVPLEAAHKLMLNSDDMDAKEEARLARSLAAKGARGTSTGAAPRSNSVTLTPSAPKPVTSAAVPRTEHKSAPAPKPVNAKTPAATSTTTPTSTATTNHTTPAAVPAAAAVVVSTSAHKEVEHADDGDVAPEAAHKLFLGDQEDMAKKEEARFAKAFQAKGFGKAAAATTVPQKSSSTNTAAPKPSNVVASPASAPVAGTTPGAMAATHHKFVVTGRDGEREEEATIRRNQPKSANDTDYTWTILPGRCNTTIDVLFEGKNTLVFKLSWSAPDGDGTATQKAALTMEPSLDASRLKFNATTLTITYESAAQ